MWRWFMGLLAEAFDAGATTGDFASDEQTDKDENTVTEGVPGGFHGYPGSREAARLVVQYAPLAVARMP